MATRSAGSGCITDVPGIRVGHAQRTGRGWRTGTTVVHVPAGAVAGVDVRGGGPGTHETDLLRPENMVQHVHAVCLTGGSAYGLAAATGVMLELEARGIGFPVGATADHVVPIVPAAVIYDLGRGGTFTNRPGEGFGRRALRAARPTASDEGSIGAGTGAVAGGLQGGVGTASITLPDGVVVGAIAVLNAAGSAADPATGLPWEAGGHGLRRPSAADRAALAARAEQVRAPLATSVLNTTIGVVATSASLTKAECSKFASVAHDGLARAVRPAHSLFDGDTIFGLATGAVPVAQSADGAAARARAVAISAVLEAGALCFSMACTRALLTARSWPGGAPSYRDLCPSAFAPGA